MLNAMETQLKYHPLFSKLDDRAIVDLCQHAQIVIFAAGRLLFSREEAADNVYLILEGSVSIEVMSQDGRMANISVLSELDLLGEFSVIDGGVRSANARCLSKTKTLSISRARFLSLLQHQPEFSLAIIQMLIKRLRETDVLIESISLLPLRQRVCQLLLKLCANIPDENKLTIKITQTKMADRLSVSREKVNGHLGWLQTQNVIRIRRGAVDIIHHAKLASLANNDGQMA